MKISSLYFIIVAFILISCGGTKPAVKPSVQKPVETAPEEELGDLEQLSVLQYISSQVIGGRTGAYLGDTMDDFATTLQNLYSKAKINRVGEGIEVSVSNDEKLKSLNDAIQFAKNNQLILVIDQNDYSLNQISEAIGRSISSEGNNNIVMVKSKNTTAKTEGISLGFIANDSLTERAINKTQP